MNTENKILIFILLLGLIVSTYITSISISNNKTINPFTEIKILNQKIDIKNNKYFYKNKIDCSKLHKNEQIVSYILKDNKDFKVSAHIKVFNNNELLVDEYTKATNIETRLVIKKDKKEQIYIIESTCQQGDIS